VICEIMKDDGSMTHIPDLIQFSTEHHLKMITVAALIRYRLEQGSPSAPERGIRLPTQPQPSSF
jgi:3,4-dihydroxy 2-butanone 4-phosphate synthase/GTP cyclohydrolase II